MNKFKTALRILLTSILWTPKKIGWVLRKIIHGIVIGPGYLWDKIIKSPRQAYVKSMRFRDWLLSKIDYLETESAKMETYFSGYKVSIFSYVEVGV